MSIKGYYTASQIIDEALYGVNDVDRRHYNKAVMYFMRGYRDFNLFHNEVVTESWEPIVNKSIVYFPDDLIRLLWVGISINGELFTFTRSNKIVPPSSYPLDDGLDASRDEDTYIVRSPQEGLNAKMVNVEYYFKTDMAKRRIVLKRESMNAPRYADRSEVLIGYVSSGVKQLDKTYIYGDAANMLIAYVEMKLAEDMAMLGKLSGGMLAVKKENYVEARNMYDTLQLPSIEELYDAVYETSGQGIRRSN